MGGCNVFVGFVGKHPESDDKYIGFNAVSLFLIAHSNHSYRDMDCISYDATMSSISSGKISIRYDIIAPQIQLENDFDTRYEQNIRINYTGLREQSRS